MPNPEDAKSENGTGTNSQPLVREIIEKRLGEQISSVDTFAVRAGLVLATNGVVLAAYAQLLSSNLWLSNCASLLFIPEIGLVMLSGFFAFAALAIGGEKGYWYYNPDPKKLYDLSKEKGRADLEDEVIKSMADAYDKNRETFKDKFNFLRYSTYALYGSGFIFILHLLVFFLNHGR